MILLLALGLAGGSAAITFRGGLVGEIVLEPDPREPLERIALAPVRAGVLDAGGRDCPGQEPALPGTSEAWRTLVKDLSWSHSALTLSDGGGSLAGLSVVFAPRAACLGAAEEEALRAFVRGGGGLIALGAPGEPDRRGRRGREGRGLLEELLGAERFEALPDGAPGFVAFRAGSPLAAGLGALTLEPPRKGRFLAVASGQHPYWSDSRLRPADPALPQGYQSAALTASFGKGRVAWLGFALEPASAAPAGDRGRRLARNAAAWAAGLPVVSIAPWPAPYRSAVLLRANLAGRPRNAAFVARTLLDADVRAAFVVREDSLDELAGLEPPLTRAGDIALAAREGPLPASPLEAATGRLRVRLALGAWPTGLLSRDGSEEQAARASAEAGLDYSLTEAATGRGRPTVRGATRSWGPLRRPLEVVGFARLGDDDLGLSPLGLEGLRPEWVRRRLLADFEVAAALGGLHVLSFHTQGLGAPDRVRTLSWLIAEFVERGAWIAGPAELAAWSRTRAGLELMADATAPGRLGLRLRASAGPPSSPVAVDVHPPPATRAEVEPGSSGCDTAGILGGGAERLVLRLSPGSPDYRCDVTFVP